MNKATAWFPMSAEQARQVQAWCAQAEGFALQDRLSLGAGMFLELILIPAGEFLMGARADDPIHETYRGPQHRVVIPQPFYLGKFPVTQRQWQAVMDTNPARFQNRPDHPIEYVSWEECVTFCQRVTALTGRSVRLPSEAEWEYACRAGSETAYSFGNEVSLLDQYGWYRANSAMVSQPVGCKAPNAWGLYDMHGGIDEFVQDHWHDTHADAPTDGSTRVTSGATDLRVKKGGSWYDLAEYCASAHRNYYRHDVPAEDHGFRVLVAFAEASIT